MPSLFLIYSLDENIYPYFTIKVIGHQWYWSYEYTDSGIAQQHVPKYSFANAFPSKSSEFAYNHVYKPFVMEQGELMVKIFPYFTKDVDVKFDSCLVMDDDLPFGSRRLLEVDNKLVVPVNMTLRILVTSGDVLHSWSVPELGIKMDAVPGRLNQFITVIRKPGIYYGQCSEICGIAHGFMPIVVQAVDWETFSKWLKYSNVSYVYETEREVWTPDFDEEKRQELFTAYLNSPDNIYCGKKRKESV